MSFSKSFPKTVKGSTYPQWEEVFLTDEEEKQVEEKAKQENIKLMKESLEEAKKIFEDSQLKDFQKDLVRMAVALFEKKSSHVVYWKESKCKEKFDRLNK